MSMMTSSGNVVEDLNDDTDDNVNGDVVTGCRKIPTTRGENQTWAAGSKGNNNYHVAVKAGFYRKAVEVCYIYLYLLHISLL